MFNIKKVLTTIGCVVILCNWANAQVVSGIIEKITSPNSGVVEITISPINCSVPQLGNDIVRANATDVRSFISAKPVVYNVTLNTASDYRKMLKQFSNENYKVIELKIEENKFYMYIIEPKTVTQQQYITTAITLK